jgi:coiled-coil and C2 domain-containing protein 2A
LGGGFDLTFSSLSDLTNLDGTPIDGHKSSFGILITDLPRNIKVNIYEVGVIADNFVGELFIPIPEIGVSASSLDRQSNQVHFSSVDSSIEGLVNINVSWGGNSRMKLNTMNSSLPTDPITFHGTAGLLNLPKMIEWILKTNFDPNDPRNMDLVRIRELVDSVMHEDGNSLSDYTINGIFRAELPLWLQRLTLGVGVILN